MGRHGGMFERVGVAVQAIPASGTANALAGTANAVAGTANAVVGTVNILARTAKAPAGA